MVERGKHLLYSVSKAATNTIWVYSLESKKGVQIPDVETSIRPSPSFFARRAMDRIRDDNPLADRIRSLRSRSADRLEIPDRDRHPAAVVEKRQGNLLPRGDGGTLFKTVIATRPA
jgi:hypothetical protein